MGEPPARSLDVAPPDASDPVLGVLFFVDADDEDPDETLTYVATAGLCRAATPWSQGGAEILLCVKGDFDLDELLPLGNVLGAVGVQLLAQPEALQPGAVFELGELPVFEGMTHVLVTRWGDDDAGALPDTTPPVHLLSANALYDDEAMALQGMDETEALAWLDEQGVDVDDPLRDSAVDAEMSEAMGMGGLTNMLGGISPEQAMAALSGQGGQFELAQAMQQMAGDMQSVIEQSMPGFLEQMQRQMAAAQGQGAPGGGDINAMLAQLQNIIAQAEGEPEGGDGALDTHGEDVTDPSPKGPRKGR
jgi:hypothetical protein